MSTKKLHDDYGQVVRVNPNTLSFITAQSWKDIHGYLSGKRQLPKPHFIRPVKNGQSQSLGAIIDEAEHARVRGLLSPAFSERAMREQESLIMGYIDLLIQRLRAHIHGGEVDLVRWYNFTTFDIVGDLSLGQSFGSLESGDYHSWISNIFWGVKKVNTLAVVAAFPILEIVMSLAVRLYPKALEGQRVHKEYTKVALQKRLATKTEKKDFISYILRPENERGLTVDEIHANAPLLLLAGSETLATALSGATYYLLTKKPALEKVCKEVRGAFQNEGDITFTSVARLPYLNAVIEEILRLYPPVPSSQRRVTLPEGNVIDGHFVPGNVSPNRHRLTDNKADHATQTKVGVSGLAAYLSKDNFRDPEDFIPERWLGDQVYADDQRGACQPFAFGPRNCIGKR